MTEAVSANGATVLPAGTAVVGNVTDVERSGRVKGRARLAYRFNSLTHGGRALRHRDRAALARGGGHQGRGRDEDRGRRGAGAAVGALLGGGDGAAKGAAIGGAGGTGVVLATRGEEVRLGPGATVTTRLTAPLTVRIAN